MARQPNRTPQEKLEDLFFDMSVPEQEKALAMFQTLHRMKRRLYDKPGQAQQGTLLDVTDLQHEPTEKESSGLETSK